MGPAGEQRDARDVVGLDQDVRRRGESANGVHLALAHDQGERRPHHLLARAVQPFGDLG